MTRVVNPIFANILAKQTYKVFLHSKKLTEKNSIDHCCQHYCPALLHLIQGQEYCSILLTIMINVGSKTLISNYFVPRAEVDPRPKMDPLRRAGTG